jgi:hypothetical protein
MRSRRNHPASGNWKWLRPGLSATGMRVEKMIRLVEDQAEWFGKSRFDRFP